MRQTTPTAGIRFPAHRVAQLRAMAANQGKTTTALFTELVRKEWARSEKIKLPPLGFVAELSDDGLNVVVGGDHIGVLSLTVAEAREFCRGAALVLSGKRPVAAVIASQASEPAMIRINRQGCGYTLALVRGDDAEKQSRQSQGIGSTLLKDLISAVIDRAMALPVSA